MEQPSDCGRNSRERRKEKDREAEKTERESITKGKQQAQSQSQKRKAILIPNRQKIKPKSIFSASLTCPVLKRPPEAPCSPKGPPGTRALNTPPQFPHSRILITITLGLIRLVPKRRRVGRGFFHTILSNPGSGWLPQVQCEPK